MKVNGKDDIPDMIENIWKYFFFQTTNQLWYCSISRSRYIKIHQVSQMYPKVSDSIWDLIVWLCASIRPLFQYVPITPSHISHYPYLILWSECEASGDPSPERGASSSPLSQKKGHGLWQPAWHLLKCLQSQDWVKTLVKICENIDNIISTEKFGGWDPNGVRKPSVKIWENMGN